MSDKRMTRKPTDWFSRLNWALAAVCIFVAVALVLMEVW